MNCCIRSSRRSCRRNLRSWYVFYHTRYVSLVSNTQKKQVPCKNFSPSLFPLHPSIKIFNALQPPCGSSSCYEVGRSRIAQYFLFHPSPLDPFLPPVAVVVKDSQPLVCRVPHSSITAKVVFLTLALTHSRSLQPARTKRTRSPQQILNISV